MSLEFPDKWACCHFLTSLSYNTLAQGVQCQAFHSSNNQQMALSNSQSGESSVSKTAYVTVL